MDLWLKIKFWIKITISGLVTLFVLIFILQNLNKPVKIWLWNDIDTTLLKVLLSTVGLTILATLLLWTTYKTIRQFRELRLRSRTQKLEREMADMKTKAAMLQTKGSGTAPDAPSGATSPPADSPKASDS